ncbi:hypothetical protein QJS10_CPB19g01509 [Acorus calamus]|uniref:F-box protein At3g26010-like beta-propeller domain-containing protein n=1 Tax=Acorus calamus TaxID=4465 RepID=A0AAV9CDS4_ACOCL|nr:hypothetical protein QJS10_CPB19g01509 [Acorus calamus]
MGPLPFLPMDLIVIEIFPHLPVKNLFKFKCVSKEWETNISNPSFIKHYRSKNPPCEPVGFFYIPWLNSPKAISFFPLSKEGYTLTKQPTFKSFLSTLDLYIRVSSPEGLLLCTRYHSRHEEYFICDPITGVRLKLPMPNHRLHDSAHVGLICSLSSSSYQVVCLFTPVLHIEQKTNVIELESYSSLTGAWRTTTHHPASAIGFIAYDDIGVALNEAFHWIDSSGNIVSYNPDKNLLGLVKLPLAPYRGPGENLRYSLRATKEGYLRYSTYDYDNIGFKIWVLEDYNRGTWTLKYNIRDVPGTSKSLLYPHLDFLCGEMLDYDLESGNSELTDFSVRVHYSTMLEERVLIKVDVKKSMASIEIFMKTNPKVWRPQRKPRCSTGHESVDALLPNGPQDGGDLYFLFLSEGLRCFSIETLASWNKSDSADHESQVCQAYKTIYGLLKE